jgi:hypothetical protein
MSHDTSKISTSTSCGAGRQWSQANPSAIAATGEIFLQCIQNLEGDQFLAFDLAHPLKLDNASFPHLQVRVYEHSSCIAAKGIFIYGRGARARHVVRAQVAFHIGCTGSEGFPYHRNDRDFSDNPRLFRYTLQGDREQIVCEIKISSASRRCVYSILIFAALHSSNLGLQRPTAATVEP